MLRSMMSNFETTTHLYKDMLRLLEEESADLQHDTEEDVAISISSSGLTQYDHSKIKEQAQQLSSISESSDRQESAPTLPDAPPSPPPTFSLGRCSQILKKATRPQPNEDAHSTDQENRAGLHTTIEHGLRQPIAAKRALECVDAECASEEDSSPQAVESHVVEGCISDPGSIIEVGTTSQHMVFHKDVLCSMNAHGSNVISRPPWQVASPSPTSQRLNPLPDVSRTLSSTLPPRYQPQSESRQHSVQESIARNQKRNLAASNPLPSVRTKPAQLVRQRCGAVPVYEVAAASFDGAASTAIQLVSTLKNKENEVEADNGGRSRGDPAVAGLDSVSAENTSSTMRSVRSHKGTVVTRKRKDAFGLTRSASTISSPMIKSRSAITSQYFKTLTPKQLLRRMTKAWSRQPQKSCDRKEALHDRMQHSQEYQSSNEAVTSSSKAATDYVGEVHDGGSKQESSRASPAKASELISSLPLPPTPINASNIVNQYYLKKRYRKERATDSLYAPTNDKRDYREDEWRVQSAERSWQGNRHREQTSNNSAQDSSELGMSGQKLTLGTEAKVGSYRKRKNFTEVIQEHTH
ncbi:hypothetical protein EDD11_001871 [Mortierella claussenii]|nr:hypothetical protein EDD11_001871 [Mortierella claussenii]